MQVTKKKSLVSFLITKYLRFDKDQPFIFLSAFLAYIGIALGVMVLIIAMALMNGMSKHFEKSLLVMESPITIWPKISYDVNNRLLLNLKKNFPYLKFSAFIRTQAFSRSLGAMNGGLLFGVNFEDEILTNKVVRNALKDKLPGKFEVIIGKTLLNEYGLNLKDKLTYIFTDVSANGFSITPKMKRFKVAATFTSGLINFDKAYHYATLESVRKIKGWPKGLYSGIHVYSNNPMKDIKAIKAFLPSTVKAVGWWKSNASLFSALEIEKRALFIVLMLIVLIAAINIISSLLMTVMNRRSEIALLLTLGATPKEIKYLFIKLAIIIGIIGIASGVIFGFTGMWILETYDIIPWQKDVYGTSKPPINLDTLDFIFIIVGAFFIVLISSFYPAKKAGDVDPLTVLRNE